MFHVYRTSSDTSEIRFDFRGRGVEEIPPIERRALIRLGPSLDAVNAWLRRLAADTRYSEGTVYEYSKVLLYALEWLAQEPVNISTQGAVGHSLLSLSPSDLRSLFAWLDIPARRSAERANLARSGILPSGHRKNALSPSTRNVRNAAFSTFYDWAIAEYRFVEGSTVEIIENPLKDMKHPLSHFQQRQRSDGLLPRSWRSEPEPSSPFRRPQEKAEPIALAPRELHFVLDAIPLVSHGWNAANRNGALIRLLLWGMLRREELMAARWELVDGENLWVVGKGGKRRVVPIADASVWSYLQAYTNELHIPSEQRFHGVIFRQLDHEDRPITRNTIEHLIGALRRHFLTEAAAMRNDNAVDALHFEALAGKLRSHIFRTTGATYMAKAGMSLVKLSLLLGHSDPSTTMRYYIAAEQLSLTEDVQRICEGIAATFDSPPPSNTPHGFPNRRSWYQRRGIIS